tara:strand:- start:617 stop:838 length:222 start_codon:yes stop_codon:yes gene_type:complete
MLNSNTEILLKIADIRKKLFEHQLDCQKFNKLLKTEEFTEDKKFNKEKIIYTILISVIVILNLTYAYLIIKKK